LARRRYPGMLASRRHRHRHPRIRFAPYFRAVLPRGQGAFPRAGGDRAGFVHRQTPGPGHARHRRRQQPPWGRYNLYSPPPAPACPLILARSSLNLLIYRLKGTLPNPAFLREQPLVVGHDSYRGETFHDRIRDLQTEDDTGSGFTWETLEWLPCLWG